MGGMAVGAGLGLVVGGLVMMGALLVTWPRVVSHTAVRSRLAIPLMAGGVQLCGLDDRYFPGSTWLRQQFLSAQRRAHSRSQHS
jgi:hypothetical protein